MARTSSPDLIDLKDPRSTDLGSNAGMVAGHSVVLCRRATGLRRAFRRIGVLVVAIDDGSHSGLRASRNAKVVVQVAVTAAGDAALTDCASVHLRRCDRLGKCAAWRSGSQVLGKVHVPNGTRWIVVRRIGSIVVRTSVPNDVNLAIRSRCAPGINCGLRGTLIDLIWARPCL